MIQTELTRRLNLRLPIFGAPMGGAAGGALAHAVSAAGGLGMIGASNAVGADYLSREAEIAAADGTAFGVGLQVWSLPAQPGMVEAVLAARPAVVSLSFGAIEPYADAVHEVGALIAVQVNSVADARVAQAAGADIVVAQGTEAGGHTGRVATLPLLQAVLDTVDLPVVAAGGIGTGRGLAAVLAAGAQAAWIGTRLLTTTEAAGSAAAKKRVIEAAETDTVLTRAFDVARGLGWPARYPGRAVRNAFTDRWDGREDDLDPVGAGAGVREELAAATGAGDVEVTSVYAGQAVALVHDERPAGEVVTEMAADAERRLRAVAGLLS